MTVQCHRLPCSHQRGLGSKDRVSPGLLSGGDEGDSICPAHVPVAASLSPGLCSVPADQSGAQLPVPEQALASVSHEHHVHCPALLPIFPGCSHLPLVHHLVVSMCRTTAWAQNCCCLLKEMVPPALMARGAHQPGTGLRIAAMGREMLPSCWSLHTAQQQLDCDHCSQLFLVQDKGDGWAGWSLEGWISEAGQCPRPWAAHGSDQPHRSVCSGCSHRKPVVPSRGWKPSTSPGRPGGKSWRSPTPTSPGSPGPTSTWWKTRSSRSSSRGSCCEYGPEAAPRDVLWGALSQPRAGLEPGSLQGTVSQVLPSHLTVIAEPGSTSTSRC